MSIFRGAGQYFRFFISSGSTEWKLKASRRIHDLKIHVPKG